MRIMEQKIEKATVMAANDLISYAEGGIVSKEFIHSKAGSITQRHVDMANQIYSRNRPRPTWMLSEHTAPYDALVQVIDGEAEIMIAGKLYHPKAGQMLIIPQNALHAVNAAQRFKMMLTMIRG